MAKVLLTYDVKRTSDTIHTVLKKTLIEKFGFSSRILGNSGKWYDLPNTCLRKDNTTHAQTAVDFEAACRSVGAVWEKYIAADFSDASFNNQ